MASPLGRQRPPDQPRRDSKGLRQVLDLLAGREVPATAQSLFIELRAQGQRLGLATVYRALHLLRDQGRLHEFAVQDGTAYRACTPEPHHHLLCTECGRVQEGRPTQLIELVQGIQQDGFTVTTSTIEVHGICHRCHHEQQS